MAWWELLTMCVLVVWAINTRDKAKSAEAATKRLQDEIEELRERLNRSGY